MMSTPNTAQSIVLQTPVLKPKQILKVLAAELTMQKRRLALVRDQNNALLACDRVKFADVHHKYVALSGEMEIQHKLRTIMLGGGKLGTVCAEWPEADRRAAEIIAKELRAVLEDVKRLSDQNKKLIANQMKYIDFMLDILVKTHRKGATYGPQGQQALSRGNILFNSAA